MSNGESGEAPARVLIVDDEPAVREALRRSLAFEGTTPRSPPTDSPRWSRRTATAPTRSCWTC